MKQKMRKALKPEYLSRFRCIGSPCEDNCCIGWDVDFDRRSYSRYATVREGELGSLFRSCVRVNPDAFSDEVDYATVRLKKNKVCPFLNDKHLCKIQMEKGEAWLSNVCATFPRYTNRVDGVFEHAATVSCPEAARLILMNPAPMRFIETEEPSDSRTILTYAVETAERGHPARVRHLKALRAFALEQLQDRSRPLPERILGLGPFFEAFDARKSWRPEALKALMDRHRGAGSASLNLSGQGTAAQLQLLKELTDILKVFSEVDSRRYIAFSKEFLRGVRPTGTETDETSGQLLEQGMKRHLTPFLAAKGYLLENYLVNFVYKELFPAAEGENAFEAYTLLVIRYGLIRLHLCGIALHRGELTEELAVSFIQAFSKTVEHHKTFLETLSGHLRHKRYNTMTHMGLLIGE